MEVYQAETGILLPTRTFRPDESITDLREEIKTLTSTPQNAQILLTAKGFQLKPAAFEAIVKGKDGAEGDKVCGFVLFERRLWAGGWVVELA
ncbi:hypothetical protein HDV00_011576 [Rhizophlyctis rosea]|nr:hypothetical protein HDV00_011576 [Rhizophlyctis rosea]